MKNIATRMLFFSVMALSLSGCDNKKNNNNMNDRALSSDTFSMIVKIYTEENDPIKTPFLEALKGDIKGGKSEKGNINFQLFQNTDNSNHYLLYEMWENRDALDYHFKQPWTKKVLDLGKKKKGKDVEFFYLKDLAPIPEKNREDFTTNLKSTDLIVEFTIKEGMKEQFLAPFLNSIKLTRENEKGNISFHLYELEQPNKYLLMERWKTKKALEEHHKKEYTKKLFQVFKEVLDESTFDGNTFLKGVTFMKELSVD